MRTRRTHTPAVVLATGILLLSGSEPTSALPADTRPGSDVISMAPQVAGPVTPRQEADALRRANGHEWRGDLVSAEAVLEELLAAKPTSTGGLFALERVTRARNRLTEVLPFVDRYLEADPSASGIRSMKLRVLAEVDSVSALRPAARAWFEAEPASETPWREVSRVWKEAFGPDEAIALLQAGRAELGDSAALALELGDLRAEQGDAASAVAEWSRAVTRPELDLQALLRRMERLEGDPAVWAIPLLDALVADGAGADRREAAALLALDLGLPDRAATLAKDAAEALSGDRRRRFLETLAGKADEVGATQLRLWALTRQRADREGATAPRLDLQIASAALAAGDTAQAVEAQARLARSLPVGSAERRGVIADLIRVESATAPPATLRTRLDGFRAEYPDASEFDELTARVAAGLAARGHMAVARDMLAGDTPGPLSLLERGYLHLESASEDPGMRDAGVADLEAALPGLAPSRATEVLQLLTSLERTSAAGAVALGAAEAAAHRGRPDRALERVEATLPTVEPKDRPVLLSAAGRYAAAANDLDAAALYLNALVGGFPSAPERPEGVLRLARIQAQKPGGLEDARQLLEALILEAPEGAIVPAARRELQKLREMGG